jgi:hypothetical protein
VLYITCIGEERERKLNDREKCGTEGIHKRGEWKK